MTTTTTTTSKPKKSLGPVADLEHHLPPEWWRSLFNAIYLKTDGDVVENEANTKNDIDMLLDTIPLDKNSRIIDLCCGQGRHVLELASRGFSRVFGLDRSRYLIRLAKKRSSSLGLKTSFHEGDVRKFRMRQKGFDLATLMGNSFGYFDSQDDDLTVLENVRSLLRPGGFLVIDITDGEWMRRNFTPRSWEWIDQEHLVNRERSLSGDMSRLISRELVIHSEKGVLADQFYAERLYGRDEIKDLLERAGFEEIALKGDITSESTRNQDLGMMGHRIVISCKTPIKPGTLAATAAIKSITVLLGDPSLPDTVKLGGKFNEEDFATVNKLKQALASLTEWSFEYHDAHTTMLAEIARNKPQLALNLCDEGFANDATKELHVPAYLEMLDIPYTGAGPKTLGLCYDKSFTRLVAESLGIPVPMQSIIAPTDDSVRLPSIFPALLKPNTGDSSIGITKDAVVHNADELVAYFNELKQNFAGTSILVQEFLSGPEYTVGLIGNPGIGFEMLPILTVDYSALDNDLPPILGYESKWDPASPYWKKIRYSEALDLTDEKRRALQDYSSMLFEKLECRDYARFDFRTDLEGEIKLLEVNPNPGWCWDGKFNLMAEMAGYSYAQMLQMIIKSAQVRIEQTSSPAK